MRPNTRSIHLAGRISDKTASPEDIDFIESKINLKMTDSMIIQQAIRIWRLYETGDIFNSIKKDLIQELRIAVQNANITQTQISATNENKPNTTNREAALKKTTEKESSTEKTDNVIGFSDDELMDIFQTLNNT